MERNQSLPAASPTKPPPPPIIYHVPDAVDVDRCAQKKAICIISPARLPTETEIKKSVYRLVFATGQCLFVVHAQRPFPIICIAAAAASILYTYQLVRYIVHVGRYNNNIIILCVVYCTLGISPRALLQKCTGTRKTFEQKKCRNRLAENKKTNSVESRIKNWSFAFVDQPTRHCTVEGKVICFRVSFLPHTTSDILFRRYFINLGAWAGDWVIKEIVLDGLTSIHMMRNKRYALLLLAPTTAGSDGRGAIYSYTITICSYNRCVDRYHELLFFNQIIMIIINRHKLKRAFHIISRRFEYRMRIL